MKFNLENLSLDRKFDIVFRAINFFQPGTKQLTDLEITLVRIIATLPDKFKYAPFSLPAKKHVRLLAKQDYNWELSQINLNNKLYSLRDKGLIYHDSDGVMYFTPTFDNIIKQLKDAHYNQTTWELAFSFSFVQKAEGTEQRSQVEDQREEETEQG